MSRSLPACAEIAGPVCLHLAERWQNAEGNLNECQRRNLQMATIVVLRMLAAEDQGAEVRLKRASTFLKR
jgi:hypothetical protein